MAEKKGSKKEEIKYESKEKALEGALKNIEKKFGEGSVMKLGDEKSRMNVEVTPTGSLSLDIALGAGGI
ncbi:MAG: DNA recombination/repair protein RecA, partial [Anaerotignaceae bacterium]